MSWFSSFLHPERGYKSAQDQMQNYYNQAQGYSQPYNQYGMNAYNDYSTAMKALLDPQALQDKWISGYKESEAAKNAENLAKQHGLDAASSLGLMGSSPALNAIQAGTSQIGMEDRQNYLNDLMQKYLSGSQIAGNIFNTGANTANNMSQNAMNMGQNMAQLKFGETNAPGEMFGKTAGTIGKLAANYLTGGFGKGGSFGRGAWSTGVK